MLDKIGRAVYIVCSNTERSLQMLIALFAVVLMVVLHMSFKNIGKYDF